MKIKEIMQKEVITVQTSTSVADIARLLVKHRIGAVPVIDEHRRVVGIVSESDLFLKEKGIPFSAVKLPQLFKKWVEPDKLAEIYTNARDHTAEDVMTRDVICADVEEDIGQIARRMAQNELRRMPVLEEGVLAGFVSRADLIRLLAESQHET